MQPALLPFDTMAAKKCPPARNKKLWLMKENGGRMKTPLEIAQKYCAVGEGKAALPTAKLFVLGIFAGIFIALGAFGSSIASCGAGGRLAGACVFPVGLTMVVVTGAELFTGNCLLIIPVLAGKMKVSALVKNWFFSYTGNFVGSLIVALLVCLSRSCVLSGLTLPENIASAALSKVNLSFTNAFIRGALCNIMVCAAVWMSFASDDLAGKIPALFLPIALFVLCGFEHSVANMYFIPAGIFVRALFGIPTAGLSWSAFIVKNLVPVTLGNIVGGAFFVGGLFYFLNLHRCENKEAQ